MRRPDLRRSRRTAGPPEPEDTDDEEGSGEHGAPQPLLGRRVPVPLGHELTIMALCVDRGDCAQGRKRKRERGNTSGPVARARANRGASRRKRGVVEGRTCAQSRPDSYSYEYEARLAAVEAPQLTEDDGDDAEQAVQEAVDDREVDGDGEDDRLDDEHDEGASEGALNERLEAAYTSGSHSASASHTVTVIRRRDGGSREKTRRTRNRPSRARRTCRRAAQGAPCASAWLAA